MNTTEIRIAILGDGRLAHHMRHYLELEGYEVSAWARNAQSPFNTHTQAPAATLSTGSTDSSADELRLRRTIEVADRVLMLVSDDALTDLLARYPFLHRKPLMHCAGALSLPGVPGAHPLMTFGKDLYNLETYRSIPFVVEEGHGLEDLLPGLRNPGHSISVESKAFYHALCVVAGNFPQVLWQASAAHLQQELDIPPDALAAYLRQSLENFLSDPEGALTGPLARGDLATQERNLAALKNDPLKSLYQSFGAFYHNDQKRPQAKRNAS